MFSDIPDVVANTGDPQQHSEVFSHHSQKMYPSTTKRLNELTTGGYGTLNASVDL
jgi:hypothetical protein